MTIKRFCGVRGFTTIELIVVIVLVGILAAVAIPRLMDSGIDGRKLHDQTLAALRFAQKTAISARRTVCVNFTATTLSVEYAAYGAADCASPLGVLPGPDGQALTVSASGGATFTGYPATLVIDAQGLVATTATISVSDGTTVIMEAGTGYVH